MTYLADVNVICEPSKLRPRERVLKWLEDHETGDRGSATVLPALVMTFPLVTFTSSTRRGEPSWVRRKGFISSR